MNSPTKLRLSTLQAQVVEHVDGALLVVAGPGSGKTRVLT
ncbi:UvrD-helicase domain-containing protein [Burkholderia multivorans]|nr:UvrD-helicase domain-containing protein [Burkholderia multivorans]